MQPCLFIEVLVLQSERLMGVPIDPLILFQTTSMLTSDEVVKEQIFQTISMSSLEVV